MPRTLDEAAPLQTLPAPTSKPADVYPARLTVRRPGRQRVLTNFPLFAGGIIRLLLLVPHYVFFLALAFLYVTAYVASGFGIMFTGRFPRGLFKLQLGILRWQANVYAYYLHLSDDYPPFDLDQRPTHPLRFEVDFPERPSRFLNAPLLGGIIRLLLIIPHIVVLYCFQFLAGVVIFIAEFAIVFTGRFPPGLFDLVLSYLRWYQRVLCYLSGLTDRYPPFSLT